MRLERDALGSYEIEQSNRWTLTQMTKIQCCVIPTLGFTLPLCWQRTVISDCVQVIMLNERDEQDEGPAFVTICSSRWESLNVTRLVVTRIITS